MKKQIFSLMAVGTLLGTGCNQEEKIAVETTSGNATFVKPPSGLKDTMWIYKKTALFFKPTSQQLEQLEQLLPPEKMEPMMHEYFYQMRNARNVLAGGWKDVTLVDSSTKRWVALLKGSGATEVIDLDANNEPCGLYLFDTAKSPLFVDMMNIETAAGFYFAPAKPD